MLTDNAEDFDFYVVPKRAEFSIEKGGASRHLLVNGTNQRIAIKIKCSNNRLYKVSPVYAILNPGCAKRLQILREPGDGRIDKLVLLYKNTRLRNAREAFQADSGIGQSMNENETSKDVVKRVLLALISKPPTPTPLPSTSQDDAQTSEAQIEKIPFIEEI